MRRSYIMGLAFAATLGAGQASAQELTGTLKNIEDTGSINAFFMSSSNPSTIPAMDR